MEGLMDREGEGRRDRGTRERGAVMPPAP